LAKKRGGDDGGSGTDDEALATPNMRELEELDSRANSNPGNPIQIRAVVNAVRTTISVGTTSEGTNSHIIGTTAMVLYNQFAERVYNHEEFVTFARIELGLGRTKLYDCLVVARYATQEQAELGTDVCLAGARIVRACVEDEALRKRLGVKGKPDTITDIADIEFELSDGTKVQFVKGKINSAKAEALLAELFGQSKRQAGRLPPKYKARNERLAVAIARRPLKGVTAKYVMAGGKPKFTLKGPGQTDLAVLGAAFIEAAEDEED
jgi:hypothetical protein